MALLNYANQYTEILDINKNLPTDNRLIFTGDKHIITHGVDYLADYNGTRGLVPSYKIDLDDFGVLGKEGWTKITTSMLPIASDLTANGIDSIFTSQQIQELIKNGFAANDAMVFKGVLVKSEDKLNNIANAFAQVPTKGYSAGWTYRVAEAGEYAGQICEVGDWIIATSDRTEASVNAGGEQITNSEWSVIQTNISGTATITLNGTEYIFATNKNQNTSVKLYAPDNKGAIGQILSMGTGTDSDGLPPLTWIDQSSITAGNALQLEGKSAADFVKDVIVSDQGQLVVTKGANSSYSDIIAKKLLKGLTIGSGLDLVSIADDGTPTVVTNKVFDGSNDYTIFLSPASTNSIGGVKVGDGIEVDENGVIYLTQAGLKGILGQDFDSIANTAIVNTTSNGLAPQITDIIEQLPQTLQILGYDPDTSKTTPGWYEIPRTALTNTWREIQINGSSIGDKILNIIPSEEIHIIKDDSTNEDVYEIGFGLSWYNITTKKFETT